MSGQWELVGNKKKDKSSGNGKPASKQTAAIKEPQHNLMNGVKVEEVFPMSQLKNLYGSKGNKENRKPAVQSDKDKSKKDTSAKDKQQQQQQQAKAQEAKAPKTKIFKSIETAYHAIKPEELSAVYDKNKVVYPTTPIVWLRELSQYLNTHINVEITDVTFATKPDNYPLCTMPNALRAILEKGLKQAGPDNCTLFYDICLTSMANDMNKNLPAIGHKLFIQLLALQQPTLSIGNIPKYATLRNSYQNRPNIGMSILWALGQGGFKDLQAGLQTFQDLMHPLLDLKHYTRFVLKYLAAIIRKHSQATQANSKLSIKQYLYVVDLIYGNKKNMTADLNRELYELMPLCNELVVNTNTSEMEFVEILLQKSQQTVIKACRNHLNWVLVTCMQRDVACFTQWGEIYGKNLPASACLLQYIEQNWRTLSDNFDMKALKDFLKGLTATNEQFAKDGRQEDGLDDCIKSINKLNTKMAGTKKKGRSKCRFLLYLMLAALAGFIYVDCKQNGGWTNSCISDALNKTGVYNRAFECTQWVHTRLEGQFPGITESTIQYTAPYIELGRDLGAVACNICKNAKEGIMAQVPYVIDTIESYAPGLIEKTQTVGKNVWTMSVEKFESGKQYLLTNVFVGKMAPAEIQKAIIKLGEEGIEKIQDCYEWVHAKIMSATKTK